MRIRNICLLLILCFSIETFGKEIYLITTPNLLLSDAIHKFNVYVSTNTTFVIETTHVSSNITNRTEVVFLEKGFHSVSYFVPFIGRHLGSKLKLKFLGDKCPCKSLTMVTGDYINETRQIDLLIDNFIIFTETDKPIYKPGDVVKLRTMAIYATNLMLNPPPGGPYTEIMLVNGTYSSVPALKSQKNNFDSITIETADNTKMAQWLNVSFEEAMRLSFKLSKDPMFGKWQMKIVLGSKTERAEFTVKKYVLPRFVVDINPPIVLLVSETVTNFSVCATYSTGKNLQALIQGQLCFHLKQKTCRDFVSSLNGKVKCSEISMSDSLFGLKRKGQYFRNMPTLSVTVRENGTTHEVTKNATLPGLTYQAYKIKITDKGYFKPGLPYFGIIKLQRHDGRAQKNTRVLVNAYGGFYSSNWGFQQNFTSNRAGIVEFVIPYIPFESRISIDITGDKGTNDSSLEEPRIYHSVSNWESIDNEYLQISVRNKKKIKCPGKLPLTLIMNGNISSVVIYAQLFSRGLITKMIQFPAIPVKCLNRNDHIGHYECAKNNRIRCLDGWTGNNCREPLCEDGCLNGACIRKNYCSCKIGWEGKSCETCIRASKCVNGDCMYGNDCQCRPGWTGYQCDKKGPLVHQFVTTLQPPVTTMAPKPPRAEFENITIFERFIDIDLEKDMGPDLHLVVYYVNSNNEVVADSLEVVNGLTSCSQVGGGKFKFSKKVASPREIVKLTLDPGTDRRSCALRISDVALAQFGKSSNINIAYLVQKLIVLSHSITKEDRSRLGQEVCFKSNRTKRSIYRPWYGMGYDSRKAFVQAGLTPITNARIVNVKCRTMMARQGLTMQYDGITNRRYKVGGPMAVSEDIKKQIRDFFPETWVFDFYNNTPSQFNLTVPDSMTSWRASSFCMTERGIWIPKSRILKVLLPFFADIYVPYSVKMGEQLQLPVKLFNYVDACYEIRAEISVKENEIKVKGPTSFTVCVCSGDVKTLNFYIKAKVIGNLNVTVHANSKYSSFCSNGKKENKAVKLSDSVRRQLLVEPPGIPSESILSEIICNSNEQLGQKAQFEIPEKIVSGSLRSYLVYSGDVMGQTFDNLDRLVLMPYGCGEQNMVAFVPSIYVLDYLTNLKISNPALENKAKQYIVDGYERQLKFKHYDGSYSAFGKSDKVGSTWLTAFVLKSFTRASKYVTLNKAVLKQSVTYLEKMQLPNGCFEEKGKLLSGNMAGGLNSKGKTDESLLTAYVLIGLKSVRMMKTTFDISKAVACVKAGLINQSSAYRLALSGYALSLYEDKYVASVVDRLKNVSSVDGRYRYWKSGLESPGGYMPINAADVETTGYALLALNNYEELPYLASIVYWLSSKQNSLGGYYSTQDTIVALNAISVYAEKIGTTSFQQVNLTVVLDGETVRNDTIKSSDRMITRKVSLGSRNISYVSFTTNGTGCVSLQIIALYNIEKLYSANEEFKIRVKSTLTDVKICKNLEITICSSYLRKDRDSNMILITVDFPSGWQLGSVEKTALLNLIQAPLKRIDILKNKLHLYYDSFSYSNGDQERCVTFRLDQITVVKDLSPSFVRIVDYYKPEIYTDTSYTVPTGTCQNTTTDKPKPRKELLCPKCFNDTSSNGTLDFIKKICPWSYSGLVLATTKSPLKNRLFYESGQQVYFEWTVDLEPTNCTCLSSWSNIKEDFVVISSQYMWPEDKLSLSNTSTLYRISLVYNAFDADLGNTCSTAKNLARLITRLLPDFKNETSSANETCASCILSSNLYYKVPNVTAFICSKQPRWSLNVTSINGTTVYGSVEDASKTVLTIAATFPLENCFCLHQLQSEKRFAVVDLDNVLRALQNTSKGALEVRFDERFEIVEESVYSMYKRSQMCDK